MKKIKFTGKLSLNKETVSKLNSYQMNHVVGGTAGPACVTQTCQCPATQVCITQGTVCCATETCNCPPSQACTQNTDCCVPTTGQYC